MTAATRDLSREIGDFFSLTPDAVLDAVEQSGLSTTGLCYPLNSLENRVYEVELVDRTRLVGKFYRPGRWERETILDEHRLLIALDEAEIPTCPPRPFGDGDTLHATSAGILFALFPRVGGRSPEELDADGYEQLGRLLARIHNVAAAAGLRHRPVLSPQTYGLDCLELILARTDLPPGLRHRYEDAVRRLVDLAAPRFEGVATHVVHGDCHKGNLLRGPAGWFFLDFDDAASAPPVQDLWLLLPGRRADCEVELTALLTGYELLRDFDRSTLGLIEILRGLRYVRYAAWVASRWEDPAFGRAFPHWGTEGYWEGQVADLEEQLRVIAAPPSAGAGY